MGLIKRRKRNKNSRSITQKIRSIISIARANRRMTRSMAKKLNFISFSSIPLKKTSNNHHLRTKMTTSNKKPVDEVANLEQGDCTTAQPSGSLEVLYETDMKPSEFNITASSDAMTAGPNADELTADDAEAVEKTNVETISDYSNFDDDQIINDILDLMESHGVIENEERPRSIEEIKGDLMSNASELREHMRELLQLCNFDKSVK
ncbi:hypothetical protein CBL_02756 [Carabus blaptoides fortunei]